MSLAKSRVTDKGQVTIPIELRRMLGINPLDIVTFELRGEVIEVKRSPNIEDYFGTVEPINRPEDFDALEDAFERDVAEEVVASMNRKLVVGR